MPAFLSNIKKAIEEQKHPTSSLSNAYSAPPPAAAKPSSQSTLKAAFGSGKPIDVNTFVQAMPEFQSIRGPDGKLLPQYQVDPMKSPAFAEMSALAMTKGPTNLYKDNLNLIQTQAANSANDLQRDNSNAYMSGVSNLAQGGGADAGAIERLNRQKMLGQSAGNANIYSQAGDASGRALIADTQMKTGMLGNVASGQVNAAQYNAGAGAGDVYKGNAYDLDAWGTLGDIWGSGKVADAMEAAANKPDAGLLGQGGVLGSGWGTDKGLMGMGGPGVSGQPLMKSGIMGGGGGGSFNNWNPSMGGDGVFSNPIYKPGNMTTAIQGVGGGGGTIRF